ncbi:hypothetical protein YN1HA_3920 [Sulfurisphaera ohwakuensis]
MKKLLEKVLKSILYYVLCKPYPTCFRLMMYAIVSSNIEEIKNSYSSISL